MIAGMDGRVFIFGENRGGWWMIIGEGMKKDGTGWLVERIVEDRWRGWWKMRRIVEVD